MLVPPKTDKSRYDQMARVKALNSNKDKRNNELKRDVKKERS